MDSDMEDADTDELPSSSKLIDDFEWATKQAKLCPNRVWAVAGRNLPNLLPDRSKLRQWRADRMKRPSDWSTNESHELCTYEFCEFSERDFTGVQQRHECRKKDCSPLQGLFSRALLAKAAQEGESTVWSLDGRSMITRPTPHMAISHLWSDGTGVGAWADGEVNECLWEYFKRIARQFDCEGIWWDTLCIPKEKAAREKAIRNIEGNYENARITLVHDCFLKNWKWDPETACFAILMSPWFSRGWTALELAKSRKVKVIFKGSGGAVIKDLDEEILSAPDTKGTRGKASEMIRELRTNVDSIDKLLRILKPRHTSWAKDRAIISALLVGVNLPKGAWQQDIYRHILRRFHRTRISSTVLFHNAPTMPRIGWCPTNLLDLPVPEIHKWSEVTETPLQLEKDGSLYGKWRCIPVTDVPMEAYNWRGTHPFVKERLQFHLREEFKALKSPGNDCMRYLWFEPDRTADRALLVKAGTRSEVDHRYEYLGALYFNHAHSLDAHADWLALLGDPRSQGNEVELDLRSQGPSPEDPERAQPNTQLHEAAWRVDYMKFAKYERADNVDLQARDQLGQQPLHIAAERGSYYMVNNLLHKAEMKGILKDVLNAQCYNMQSPLHRASWGGSAAVVKLLLKYGADLTLQDNGLNTALHVAAQMGFATIVDMLVDMSDCSVKNIYGATPLHYVARHEQESMIKKLLAKRADVNARDKNGWTPAHYAAESGNEVMLLQSGADLDATEMTVGWTPLHCGAINGHSGVVKLLLEKGARSSPTDDYGWTPWRFAAVKEWSQLVGSLSENEIETQEILRFRWTSLHCAAINETQLVASLELEHKPDFTDDQENDSDSQDDFPRDSDREDEYEGVSPPPWEFPNVKNGVVELAQENRKDVLSKRSYGQTPLSWAARNGQSALVRLLLDHGANFNLRDWRRRKPLAWAARNGHETIVRELLDRGAKVKSRDKGGRTPLSWAAGNGHLSVVRQLLTKVDDVNERDKAYRSPLSWAAGNGHEAIIRLLLDSGALIDWSDREDRSPLSWAIKGGHVGAVRLLIDREADIYTVDIVRREPVGVASVDEAITHMLTERSTSAF